MTNTKTIVAIAAFAAIMASVPALLPQAEATVEYNQHYSEVAFDVVVGFNYDIGSGATWEQVTYMIGCSERLYITGSYIPGSDVQAVSWQLPTTIDGMCGLPFYQSYTNFALDSVDWRIQGPNGQSDGTVTSNMGGNGAIISGQTANSGTNYVTVTAHYQWAPTSTP